MAEEAAVVVAAVVVVVAAAVAAAEAAAEAAAAAAAAVAAVVAAAAAAEAAVAVARRCLRCPGGPHYHCCRGMDGPWRGSMDRPGGPSRAALHRAAPWPVRLCGPRHVLCRRQR